MSKGMVTRREWGTKKYLVFGVQFVLLMSGDHGLRYM